MTRTRVKFNKHKIISGCKISKDYSKKHYLRPKRLTVFVPYWDRIEHPPKIFPLPPSPMFQLAPFWEQVFKQIPQSPIKNDLMFSEYTIDR
jgi:hypothetical protein